MVPDPKECARLRAKRDAVERFSLKCPVYKKCAKTLDDMDAIDSIHAVELLLIELRGWAKAKGTVNVLEKILSFDNNIDEKEERDGE